MNQEKVYNFFKNNAGSKFKRRHLERIFKIDFKRVHVMMDSLLSRSDYYPGIREEYTTDTAENGRKFMCKQWWYEEEDKKR